MSDLAGNLGSFPLRRVLGFLADTGATGELRVQSEDGEGRVLLQDGSIGYATTMTGEDTVQELDSLLERYQQGGIDVPSLHGETPMSLEDVMRDQLTEVLYHLTLLESGSFGFAQSLEGSNSADGDTFSVEDLLRHVDVRIDEWRKIREVIPLNEADYELVWHIPEGQAEVTVSAPNWTLLAAIGGGASIGEVAAALDVYEFHAARKMAQLVEDGLLEPVGVDWDPESEPVAEGVADEAAPEAEWSDYPEPEAEWNSDLESVAGPEMPRVEPTNDPVTFSKRDLSREEMDDMIRNIGKGIFPS